MTVREYLEEQLVNNGMSESHAKQVIEKAIPVINSQTNDYKITFDRPMEEYPNVVLRLLYKSVKPVAVEWIDKNAPQAWFRPMFLD